MQKEERNKYEITFGKINLGLTTNTRLEIWYALLPRHTNVKVN